MASTNVGDKTRDTLLTWKAQIEEYIRDTPDMAQDERMRCKWRLAMINDALRLKPTGGTLKHPMNKKG